MSIEQLQKAMQQPSPPAPITIELEQAFGEQILQALIAHDPLSSLVVDLRALLSAPLKQLWAIHIIGPDYEHPMLSREHAEKNAQHICEHLRAQHLAWPHLKVNVIPSPWKPAEHFELLAEEQAQEDSRLRHGWKVANANVERLTAELAEAKRMLAERDALLNAAEHALCEADFNSVGDVIETTQEDRDAVRAQIVSLLTATGEVSEVKP